MKTFRILTAAGICFILCLATGRSTGAEDAGKEVLVILSHQAEPYQEAFKGFRSLLEGSGLKVRYSVYNLEDDPSGTERTVKMLGEERFDMCLALGSYAAELASTHFDALPVLAGMVLQQASPTFRKPNLGGVWLNFPIAAQLELLREILPESKTVGIAYNPLENGEFIEGAVRVAAEQGLDIHAVQVSSPMDLPAALDSISRRSDVIWGIPDSLVMNPQTARDIILFSFRHNIPLAGISPLWVKSGALYSMAWDFRGIGDQLGRKAAALLKEGAEILPPWSFPEKMSFVINMKTAQNLKIDIPGEVSARALTRY